MQASELEESARIAPNSGDLDGRSNINDQNRATGMAAHFRPKSFDPSFGAGYRNKYNSSYLRSSIDANESRRVEPKSIERTAKLVMNGKPRKKQGPGRQSVEMEPRGSELGTPRDIIKDQDIVVGTLFTSVELNRMIVNVGGGYLLKNEGPKKGPAIRFGPKENIDQYCYLGLGQLINKTKKRREDHHIHHLLS